MTKTRHGVGLTKARKGAAKQAPRRRAKTLSLQRVADYIHDFCFEAHRGAFWLDKGQRLAVAFGNDGHKNDSRSKHESKTLIRLLEACGAKNVGLATAGDGYTWALGFDLPLPLTPDTLEDFLWAAWHHACGQMAGRKKECPAGRALLETIQRPIAKVAIAKGVPAMRAILHL